MSVENIMYGGRDDEGIIIAGKGVFLEPFPSTSKTETTAESTSKRERDQYQSDDESGVRKSPRIDTSTPYPSRRTSSKEYSGDNALSEQTAPKASSDVLAARRIASRKGGGDRDETTSEASMRTSGMSVGDFSAGKVSTRERDAGKE